MKTKTDSRKRRDGPRCHRRLVLRAVPMASPEDRERGWILCPQLLSEVTTVMMDKENMVISPEDVESIILALMGILDTREDVYQEEMSSISALSQNVEWRYK